MSEETIFCKTHNECANYLCPHKPTALELRLMGEGKAWAKWYTYHDPLIGNRCDEHRPLRDDREEE